MPERQQKHTKDSIQPRTAACFQVDVVMHDIVLGRESPHGIGPERYVGTRDNNCASSFLLFPSLQVVIHVFFAFPYWIAQGGAKTNSLSPQARLAAAPAVAVTAVAASERPEPRKRTNRNLDL
jgi:hypothetical protein